MLRLIGGPARCGKSTLAAKAKAMGGGDHVSIDNLKYGLLAVAAGEIQESLAARPELEEYDKVAWLETLRTRDRAIWSGVHAYLNAAAENHDDVLMEGLLWPDYVAQLEWPFRAVYLVDTSPDHAAHILQAARNDATHNNWMRDRSDEWITTWAEYNLERSKLYVTLCSQANQPVFDIAELGYEQAQQAALTYLFSD